MTRRVPIVTISLVQTGTAAYYGDDFHGRPVVSGEIFDQETLTAAHNGYAYGTRVRVTNLANGNSVVVRISDRMRSDSEILIALTRRAAEELDFIREGVTSVEVTVVGVSNAAHGSDPRPISTASRPFDSPATGPR